MSEAYVSRGGDKLASVAQALAIDFRDKVVLDVGSSTGGFCDYALKHGSSRIIAVERGVRQLHPKLRVDNRIELHEKTDIRSINKLSEVPDIVVIDVSFIPIGDILPTIARLVGKTSDIIALVKPQFEAREEDKHQGIVKNNRIRRAIFKHFELSLGGTFTIVKKADSGVAGTGGNLERFYLLRRA